MTDTNNTDTDDTTAADDTPNGDTTDTLSLADLQTERDARKAAQEELAAVKAQLQKLEDAGKTEAQRNADNASKAEQRAQDAEARLAAALTRQAVVDAAIAAGTIDSDSVAVLALATGTVTVGDDGAVAGAKQAVAELAKTKPHLFRASSAGTRDASAGGTTTKPSQSIDDWIRGTNQ